MTTSPVSFFFHAPAPTDIYTYCHTLSLPDALPISPPSTPPHKGEGRSTESPAAQYPFFASHAFIQAISSSCAAMTPSASAFTSRSVPCSSRSEEHKSELQSLMRISYAVFCLKKKKKKKQQYA